MVGRSQKEIDQAVSRDSYSQASTTENRRVTLVLALTAADYDQWCKDNGKSPRDRNIVMATPASVRTLKDAHLEITARGMWRRDIHELMVALVPTLDRPSVQRVAGMGWGQPIP